jgi:hypothetical protein
MFTRFAKKAAVAVERQINEVVYKEYISILTDHNNAVQNFCSAKKPHPVPENFTPFDYDELRNLECLIKSAMQEATSGTSAIPSLPILKKRIADLVTIGSPSAFGNVATSRDFFDEFVVLKWMKNEVTISVLHELVVSLLLNEIREHTAVFTYCYGGFYCSVQHVAKPLTKEEEEDKFFNDDEDDFDEGFTSKVTEMCTGVGNERLVMASEKISGDSFAIWLSAGCEGADVLRILTHILFSLRIAQNKFNFSHNDLHGNNIIIEDYNDVPIPWTYTLDNTGITVASTFYPKIIDYGLSRVDSTYRSADTAYFRSGEKQKWMPTVLFNKADCKRAAGPKNVLCVANENRQYYPTYDIFRVWCTVATYGRNIRDFEVLQFFTDVLFCSKMVTASSTEWMKHLVQSYAEKTSLREWTRLIFLPTVVAASGGKVFNPTALNDGEKFYKLTAGQFLHRMFAPNVRESLREALDANRYVSPTTTQEFIED